MMKAALLSALMFGGQLTRAEDDFKGRRAYASCWFKPYSGWTSNEPEIGGYLLMTEGKAAGSKMVTKGVIKDYNNISDGNQINSHRLNRMRIFENYDDSCDDTQMGAFWPLWFANNDKEAYEKPLEFWEDFTALYRDKQTSATLFNGGSDGEDDFFYWDTDEKIANKDKPRSIGVYDENNEKIIACCKIEQLSKESYMSLNESYKMEK